MYLIPLIDRERASHTKKRRRLLRVPPASMRRPLYILLQYQFEWHDNRQNLLSTQSCLLDCLHTSSKLSIRLALESSKMKAAMQTIIRYLRVNCRPKRRNESRNRQIRDRQYSAPAAKQSSRKLRTRFVPDTYNATTHAEKVLLVNIEKGGENLTKACCQLEYPVPWKRTSHRKIVFGCCPTTSRGACNCT